MRKLNTTGRGTFLALLLMAVLALALVVSPPVRANDWHSVPFGIPTNFASLTNITIVSTNGTAVEVPPNALGFTITTAFHGAAAGTSNVIFGLNWSGDTTNYSTTTPTLITNSCTGTTNVVSVAVFNRTNFFGVRKLRFDQLGTTQTNAVTIDGVWLNWFE